jgi:Zn-dependent protease
MRVIIPRRKTRYTGENACTARLSLPRVFPRAPADNLLVDTGTLLSGLLYYVVFLLSTTAHEAAHAWAAKLGGDLTAYHGGQVSLDPRAHIRREPFGMVVLPLLSTLTSGWPFGFASAPYDPRWAFQYPKRAAWMAIAGPAANLALVVLATLTIRMGMLAGVFHPPESLGFGHIVGTDAGGLWPGAAALVSVVFSMNLVLGSLNLLPLPPLDGSAAIVLVMHDALANRYQQFLWGNPMFGMVGMLAAWRLFDVIFFPIFWFAVGLVYPGVVYG